MKIMSKSSGRHLVRLQVKLKPPEKGGKNIRIRKFVLYFSILQCTSYQLISVAHIRLKGKSLKTLTSSCIQNICFNLIL